MDDNVGCAAIILSALLNEETGGKGILDCIQAAYQVLTKTITVTQAMMVLDTYLLEEFKDADDGG